MKRRLVVLGTILGLVGLLAPQLLADIPSFRDWIRTALGAIYTLVNVGIGTTSPTEKLEVVGNAKVSGNLTVNTNTLLVDALSNRVGIGTASPTELLSIADNSTASNNYLDIRTAPLYRSGLKLRVYTDAYGFTIENDDQPAARGLQILRHQNDATGVSALFIERGTGNVGIGITNPTEKLQVAGMVHSTTGGIKFPDGSVQTSAAAAGLTAWTVNGVNIYNANSGNVGIGNANPLYPLDIVGDIRWTGTLQGGLVPWSGLVSFPAACPLGQFVTGLGTSLTCATPSGGTGGIGGSGTSGFYPMFINSNTIGDSSTHENGPFIETTRRALVLNYNGAPWNTYIDFYFGTLFYNNTPGRFELSDDLVVSGNLQKWSGGFVQPHSQDPTKEIVYNFFEGPDNRVFFEGTVPLIQGHAVLDIPDHFKEVAREGTLRVYATPLSAASKGVAVVKKTMEGIEFRELFDGEGTYPVDVFVTATRAGFEHSPPIRENTHFRPDHYSRDDFSRFYKGNDTTANAIRALLVSNGILTPDGKVNEATMQKCHWKFKAPGQ